MLFFYRSSIRQASTRSYRATSRSFSTPRPIATSIAPLPPLPPHSHGTTRDGGGSKPQPPTPPPPTGDTDTRLLLTPIPTRHSRKLLPDLITDTQQLQSLSEEILEAPLGSLFAFDTTLVSPHDNPDPWDAADRTVQTVEAILRGLAARVPGTCWQRWSSTAHQQKKGDTKSSSSSSSSSNDVDAVQVALAMQDLMERLYEEGLAYMNVRADRLDEIDAAVEQREQKKETGIPKLHHQDRPKLSLESLPSSKQLTQGENDADQQEKRKFLNDFALPGPTATMIDSILDVLACGAPHVSGTTRVLKMFEDADFLLHLAHARYELDGGDTDHTNPHTRPTILTFNACIRIAAQISSEEHTNEKIRDGAITLAFSTFQATDECNAVHRNTASYVYLMRTIAQTMPASRMRGNIARGVFEQARYRCLVNDTLIEAYRKANEPSNCAMDDAFLRDTLASNDAVPVKWRRESKRRRHHVREDTY